jgi:carbonic anhydrase
MLFNICIATVLYGIDYGIGNRYPVEEFFEKDRPRSTKSIKEDIQDVLKNINLNNKDAVHHKEEKIMMPRALVIGCSEAHFQIQEIDKTPFNDLCVIRNFGNQVYQKGSLDYHIHEQKIPLVIVIGHTKCNAIINATKFSPHNSLLSEEQAIEIKERHHTQHVEPTEKLVTTNAEYNVDAQVKTLTSRYEVKIKEGTLVVLGAIYDSSNYFGQGYGRLVFVNCNNQKEEAAMAKYDGLCTKFSSKKTKHVKSR